MQQPDKDGSSSTRPPSNDAVLPSHSAAPATTRPRPLRVGYALNPKKTRLFDARGLFAQPPSASASDSAPPQRPTFTPLDLSRPLAAQGPFDVLLLKLTDDMARALYNGDDEARQTVERMEAFGTDSGCVMIDDMRLVRRVLDRRLTSELLNAADITVDGYAVRAPPAIAVQLPVAERLSLPFSYPVICKSVQSCGTTSSHTFYIAYSDEQLCNLPASGSYIVQRLLPHSGTMHKVYVINGRSFVVPKPSIPPHVTAPHPHPTTRHPLTLDSQSMSLTPTHPPLPTQPATAAQQAAAPPAPPLDVDGAALDAATLRVLDGVSGRLSVLFGLTLFGFDAVWSGGGLYVVDVNYFPSYNRVDGLSDRLAAAIESKYDREMADRHRQHNGQPKEVEGGDAKTNGHSGR